jgi:hypothetical protein
MTGDDKLEVDIIDNHLPEDLFGPCVIDNVKRDNLPQPPVVLRTSHPIISVARFTVGAQ